MKGIHHIALAVILLLGFSCQSQSNPSGNKNEKTELPGETYISAFGEVRLNQINDSTYETFFVNNEGHQFDTIMYLAKDSVFGQFIEREEGFLRPPPDSEHYIKHYKDTGFILSDKRKEQE